MSKRTLGGGRILGSGKSLSPAAPSPAPPNRSRALSPTASSVSLNSQTSNSQLSSEFQDLTSRISLENGDRPGPAPAAAASTALACPICSEEMVTLLQLNRHIDDEHKYLEDERQDEVKDWFKAQMDKAKRFQPLAVLNQKLKGLDVFESNDDSQLSLVAANRNTTGQTPSEPPPRVIDPDEVVTRAHWQSRGPYDVCLEPTCGKRLTITNNGVNCRKCGKLFCEEHTMYQMKLSRSAHHEPVRGIWCRVCETCYKSREGYNDHTGLERNHTADFKALRRVNVDKAFLEVSRLEKRLTRLTQLLSTLPAEQIQSGANKRWPLSWQSDQRKTLEQSVVSWQDDASVAKCPFCQQEFSSYTFRRHHCRTCGRVVCGDPETGCSTEVGLDIAINPDPKTEKPSTPEHVGVDVRLCKECKSTLFSRRDFQEYLLKKPPDVRAYDNLIQFERGIRMLLPRFQKLLVALQDPENPPSPAQLTEATKVRKRLMDSFAQYDTAARRIRDLPTSSPTQDKLQKAIFHQATSFLHLHMLPLKTLPKILKHATPHGKSLNGLPSSSSSNTSITTTTTPTRTPPNRSTSALASIRPDTKSTLSLVTTSDNSSAISALEAEEKSLRDRLIVLEEQKFFVSEMIADANRRRKFDEVSSLAVNVEDLSREIDRVNGMLGQLDFESVYAAGSVTPTNAS